MANDASLQRGLAQATDDFPFRSMFEQSPQLLSAISVPEDESGNPGIPWCQVLFQNVASRQHYGNMQDVDLALQPGLLAQIFAIEGPEAMQVSSDENGH